MIHITYVLLPKFIFTFVWAANSINSNYCFCNIVDRAEPVNLLEEQAPTNVSQLFPPSPTKNERFEHRQSERIVKNESLHAKENNEPPPEISSNSRVNLGVHANEDRRSF